jgi:NTP pyrophosphatase (non-canonical NTP hydrolase)
MKPSIRLRDYVDAARATDRFAAGELQPILLGLFGEVGGVMATSKKHKREGEAYVSYQQAVEEELGDTLWYFSALCRRLDAHLDQVLAAVSSNGKYSTAVTASGLVTSTLSDFPKIKSPLPLDDALLDLGQSAAELLAISKDKRNAREKLITFADNFFHVLHAADVSFSDVAQLNLEKVQGRFIDRGISQLPTFDSEFTEDERIPDKFEIAIKQRKSGQVWLQWNGVFLGDPLTDNIRDPDGYRFHDVFHFAHAAVLHWSPTFRALIKHKRKSDPRVDEAQDGGRAIVVEEGLSAWIFSRAKLLNLFEGQKSLGWDLLKTIGQFVSGYEVEECPLKLWEDAILQGYLVFRQVRANNGGIVIASKVDRRVRYKPLAGH